MAFTVLTQLVPPTTVRISFPFGGRFGDVALTLALLKYNFSVFNVRLAGKHLPINCLCVFPFLSSLPHCVCLSSFLH